jgi:hypothetical protein
MIKGGGGWPNICQVQVATEMNICVLRTQLRVPVQFRRSFEQVVETLIGDKARFLKKLAPISGLKDRLSRAKKALRSR